MSEAYFTCKLDCGHQHLWGESPLTPGAALPRVGDVIHCPECGDREIVEITPRAIITISTEDSDDDVYYEVGYDAQDGGWFYELRRGVRYSSDAEYDTEEAAVKAAEVAVKAAIAKLETEEQD